MENKNKETSDGNNFIYNNYKSMIMIINNQMMMKMKNILNAILTKIQN